MKTVVLSEIIDWLRSLPPATIVYQADNINHCVVGSYAVAKLDVEQPLMGHTYIFTNDPRRRIPLDAGVTRCIDRWDNAENKHEDGLTAAEALAAVKDLIR